jgi:hypothetical protein
MDIPDKMTSKELREFLKLGVVTSRNKIVKPRSEGMTRLIEESTAEVYIGIDPGTNTGVAIKSKEGYTLYTCGILRAMRIVQRFKNIQKIVIEDANQVRFKTDPNKAQGAGSVKRDVAIWVEFCKENDYFYDLVRPAKKKTKLDTNVFNQVTGYSGKSSSHSRDAAMLLFNH